MCLHHGAWNTTTTHSHALLRLFCLSFSICLLNTKGLSGSHLCLPHWLERCLRGRTPPGWRLHQGYFLPHSLSVPLWDLVLVLKALSSVLFEPLLYIDLKLLSLKMALLLALTSVKREGDLTAFLVNPACIQFAPGDTTVILRPNCFYVPKGLTALIRSQVIVLPALDSPALQSEPGLNLFVCFGAQGS